MTALRISKAKIVIYSVKMVVTKISVVQVFLAAVLFLKSTKTTTLDSF